MPSILIAGCGYVGRATADIFHARGWQVEGWTASIESAAKLSEAGYPVHAIDISDAAAVRRSTHQFDAVIHCASSGGGDEAAYRRIYFEGTQNLIAAFPDARFLFTSSTSVYAQVDGSWVTEESAAEPTRESAKILREAEALVLSRSGIVARLAGIYGPDRSVMLRNFLAGKSVIDSGSERFLNHAHRDDIASALFSLIQGNVSGIYNVADDQPISQRECLQWLASRLGRPIALSEATPAKRKRGDSNKRVSNAKLRAIGWAPRFPTFQIAMEQSILPSFGIVH